MNIIEESIFRNAIVLDNITQDYIDNIREFVAVFGRYNNSDCYIVTASYFDAFTKSDTWLQTMIVLNTDALGNRSIDHIKSRYLKPIATTNSTIWTRWQAEDANTYNYLNGYLANGNKVILREWKYK